MRTPATRTCWPVGSPVSPINLGISGNRVLGGGDTGISSLGPPLVARLGTDLLARSDVTDVILFEGINDLGQDPDVDAADVVDGLVDVAERMRAARPGLRVHAATLTPAGGAARALAPYALREADRQAVNAAIRAGAVSEHVIDFDAAVRDPDDPSRIAAPFDGGDGLHFSAEGHAALADAVDPGAFVGRPCMP
jgi:lysophospholipase L1-like esterase